MVYVCVDQIYPFFTGRSSIELDKLAGYHKLSLELEITPYLNHQHGILIFSSQHGNGSGDFLSLALVDGYKIFPLAFRIATIFILVNYVR